MASEFRAIFTSNPEEYAGIHKSQDALMDRLITIHVDYCDRETEVAIAAARAGVSSAQAGMVVDLVRHFRSRRFGRHRPSLRAAIMIARVVAQQGANFESSDPVFQRTYRDVLGLDHIDEHGADDVRPHDLMSTELANACKLVETAIQESG